MATMAEKQKEIEELLCALETDTHNGGQKQEDFLTQLLSYTRSTCIDDTYLAPLFSKRGMGVLGRYAFGENQRQPAPENRTTALKCLNNVLDPPDKAELLPIAIILVSCLAKTKKLPTLTDSEWDDLVHFVNTNMYSSPLTLTSPATTTLKLLSTLAVRYESQAYRFLPSLHTILQFLDNIPSVSGWPLEPAASLLINCLASIPFNHHTSAEFPEWPGVVNRLTDIVRSAIPILKKSHGDEKEVLPLLMVLLRIAQSQQQPPARARLSEKVLPSSSDRVQPLGQGSSLPHLLLNLSSTSAEPQVREIILALFFELSDKSPNKFVENIGFGNAAGFISSKGLQLSPDQLRAGAGRENVDPITGQRRDMQPRREEIEMTEEDKEREAERLFVLFERLRATGVVNVQNPVAQFHDSGRFEELPEDDAELD
ncbi:guanine nucleotide exchange factor synembryn-domain-containing protein [Diplogelasinospora grovesii]|uniref:Guanine nucleotide exchange factor synembryn-domain-containing protein n=1 Tax=Diplogelasinospora grovesii TaxID=303347 RepID=A0AAN6MVJ9_9PEZI|nr:guanine nucleotide exchange factor synembryn-domain-containing protein [Diplogelasinospora grovesii]